MDDIRNVKGYVHSFQSLGTVDGPGVRAVVFFQGCPLRCSCCHNPDTWETNVGEFVSAGEIFDKIYRLRRYFGKDGGVTLSGGEPLLQSEFAAAIFKLCKQNGIHCALDTSGCICNAETQKLLELCDLVLLDYKYTNREDYLRYTGMEMERADEFLCLLEGLKKPTVIRQVVIPTVNDNQQSLDKLYALEKKYSCITKIELLPFRKLCLEKYERMGIEFPFAHIEEKRM